MKNAGKSSNLNALLEIIMCGVYGTSESEPITLLGLIIAIVALTSEFLKLYSPYLEALIF